MYLVSLILICIASCRDAWDVRPWFHITLGRLIAASCSQYPPLHRRRNDAWSLAVWAGKLPMSASGWQVFGYYGPFPHTSKVVDGLHFAVAELLGKTNGYLPTIFSSPGKLCVLCLNKYTCNSLPSILPFYFMESLGDFVYTSCAWVFELSCCIYIDKRDGTLGLADSKCSSSADSQAWFYF